jgi:ribosomal protein S18 acetylase RimI-like enzyme
MTKTLLASTTIRNATASDLDVLAEIEIDASRSWTAAMGRGQEETAPTPRYLMERSLTDELLFVATCAMGRPIGFVAGLQQDGFLYVGEIDVIVSFQRHGVGRAMMLRILEEVEARGLKGAVLTTDRFLPFNASFYASLGFRELPLEDCPPSLRATYESEIEDGHDPARRVTMAYGF